MPDFLERPTFFDLWKALREGEDQKSSIKKYGNA
jgi:hypothetical protein